MLKFTEAQWQTLRHGESRQFIEGVCNAFLGSRPEMREQSSHESVRSRMQAAYDYATRTGFNSTPHIVRLMYLSADAPFIHDDPLVDHYLRKSGATPEQRLDDLDAVMKHKLKGDR